MQINVTYDPSVANAPAAFETDINLAVQYLDSLFSNSITINIDVGYGEIDGQTMQSGALGESEAYYTTESYSAVRNALIAQGAPGSSTLPSASPLSGTLAMSTAEAKALGLIANNNNVDGYVGFSSVYPLSYGNGTTPPSNEYYFIGIVEHEITEDMGRVSLLDYQPNNYAPLDLYRYSSPGVRDLAVGGTGSTAYFSVNGGTTNLGSWNNNPSNGDLADWYGANVPNSGYDAFDDYSYPGVVNIISQSDITLMEALGWTTSTPQTAPTVTAQSFSVGEKQTVSLASYLTVSNPGGDSITQYVFDDEGGGSGYLSVGGTVEPDNQPIYVTASNLGSVEYVGGGSPGSDTLQIGAYDATRGSYYYSSAITATTNAPAPSQNSQETPNDFNGDGISDLLWRSNSSTLAEWLMNGSTISVSESPTYQGNVISPDTSWIIAGIADFNGGSDAELLWQQSSTGALAIWDMNGSRITSTAAPTYQGSAVAMNSSWNVAGTGDFNGNGDADILWRQGTDNSLQIWLMNGSTITSIATPTYQGGAISPNSSWSVAGIGDFNGSGDAEILWQQSSTGALAIWGMNGSTITSAAAPTYQGSAVSPDSSWSVVGIGDFAGTGNSDILWRQSSTGSLAMWVMNGSQITSSASITYQGKAVTPDSSWSILEVGDFNGSKDTGILWQQSSTGDLAEWQMSGSQIVTSQAITYQGSPVAPTPTSWHSQAKPTDFS